MLSTKLAQLRKSRRSDQSGFTIIEVMIVLAIAALILLIVLLAVPALQRNSRNTQRKNDVSAILAGYSTYQNDNNGAVPATCAANATGCWLKDVKIGFYDTSTATNVTWTKQTAATAAGNVSDADSVKIVNNVKCGTTSTTTTQGTNLTTTTGASARTTVALYAVESGSGTTYICQDI